ncbi:MAG: T9SS type A sorting domain-containing protein [Saprospiraceae bacterium]
MSKTIFNFFTFLFLIHFSIAAQSIIYVDVNSTDPEDGFSWGKPMQTLQGGIDLAKDGDQIWVAQGKYNPTTKDRDGIASSGADLTFFINKNITILGGFERGDDLNDRDPDSKETILDGKNNNFNHYQIVNIFNCNAIINGFTIAGGVANGMTTTLQKGAGINIYTDGKNISPSIKYCKIQDNTSDGNGGGVYVSDDNSGTIDFNFSDCSFTNNNSMSSGGGIYAENSFNVNNTLLLDNCDFSNNTAAVNGGGVYVALNYDGSGQPIFRIRDTDFNNNHANSTPSSYGGALFITTSGSATSPLIEQCQFTNNSSVNNGGAVRITSSSSGELTPTFSRCRFASNATAASGGALSTRAISQDCSPILINCIFFDNFGDASAGAITMGSTNAGKTDSQFYYCDFVSNDCDLFGAVFRLVPATSGGQIDVGITNSIFYNNTNGATPGDFSLSSSANATIEYILTDRANCASAGASSCSNIAYNEDPLFFNTATGDLRIQKNSLARENAIDLAGMGTLFQVDYAGMPRPTGSTAPDIGAYQFDKNALAVEWIDVVATKKTDNVLIEWKTTSERDITFYQVEHSHNGRNFQKIGSVAANNEATLNHYHFNHQPTTVGKQFYRIVQVENDGTTDLSKIVSIDFSKAQSIQVYPNPVHDNLHIVGNISENSIIQFVDYQGIVKKEVSYSLNPIRVNDLPTGIYLIRTKDNSWQQRILVTQK